MIKKLKREEKMKINEINMYQEEIKYNFGVLNLTNPEIINELLNGLTHSLTGLKNNIVENTSTVETINGQKQSNEMFNLDRLNNLSKSSFKQDSIFSGISQMYDQSLSKDIVSGKKLDIDMLKKSSIMNIEDDNNPLSRK